MNFYEKDTDQGWEERLIKIFYDIKDNLESCYCKDIPVPSFEITNKDWGTYHSGESSRICISRKLLRDFGLGAAKHIIGHEMAHMIVDKIFNMDDLNSHGEAFKKACKMLGIDYSRTISPAELHNFDTEYAEKEKIVRKIKKLVKLSESDSQSESEAALKKVHELMLQHNIKFLETRKREDYFIRPVGPICKKIPTYMRTLAGLIREYYFVNTVLTYKGSGKMFEFFGSKENLDIAEYVFCCLLQQGESLWKSYRDKKKAEHGYTRGLFSKVNFIDGVIDGYEKQLSAESNFFNKKTVSEEDKPVIEEECTAIIWEGDKLMEEMYKKAYPRLKSESYRSTSIGGGYHDGREAGLKLRISKGIRGSVKKSEKFIAG